MELQTLLLWFPSIHMAYRFGRKWEKVDPNISPTAFLCTHFACQCELRATQRLGFHLFQYSKELPEMSHWKWPYWSREWILLSVFTVCNCNREGLTSAVAKFSTADNHRGNKLYRVKGRTEAKQLNSTREREREEVLLFHGFVCDLFNIPAMGSLPTKVIFTCCCLSFSPSPLATTGDSRLVFCFVGHIGTLLCLTSLPGRDLFGVKEM